MRSLTLALLVALGLPQAASAKAHLWRFTEVFSNEDGTVQFIEMFVFDPAGTEEWRLAGKLLESESNTYVFPDDLPRQNTFQTWMLIATPAFASLPGAPTPDYILPPHFFDPAGDELRYRTSIDALTLPAEGFPVDGIRSYLRDGSVAVNSPTNFAGQTGSIDVSLPCDDTLDNDGDGYVDYPDDPACRTLEWAREDARCQDGLDNDGGPGTDFDGGASILGPGGADPAGPDPQCEGRPWRNREGKGCGMGVELALGLVALGALRRLRTGRRRA
jgi:hypothetical protein